MQEKVAREILNSLREAGVDFVATLTEANLHELVVALAKEEGVHHVPVTREEEGIGICAGPIWAGRNRPW